MAYFVLLCRHMVWGCIFLNISITAAFANNTCNLRVGWDDWPPYIEYKAGKFYGPEYEFLKSIANDAGCTLDMQQFPWVRALVKLEYGELDLLYSASHSAHREKIATFSIPYRSEIFSLVTRGIAEDTIKTISLRDWLQSKNDTHSEVKLGTHRGNYYGKQIEQILKENSEHIIQINLSSNNQMIKMLQTGRLDGYIVEDVIAQNQEKSVDFPIQHFNIKEQTPDPMHYMFSLKVPDDVVERFNAAISKRLQ